MALSGDGGHAIAYLFIPISPFAKQDDAGAIDQNHEKYPLFRALSPDYGANPPFHRKLPLET